MSKKIKRFSDLSEKELFKLRKKRLKRSYKEGRCLLENVICVAPSKK